MLDWDPRLALEVASALDIQVANYISLGGGRMLRGSTFFEDFCKTLCTINTSWGNTILMNAALVALVGNGTAPSPVDILTAGIDQLRGSAPIGYRAEVLFHCTEELLSNGIVDEDGELLLHDLGRDQLLALRGIGPYGADHLRVLQGDFSKIPLDSSVRRYLQDTAQGDTDINDYLQQWGSFRFLAYKIGNILSSAPRL